MILAVSYTHLTDDDQAAESGEGLLPKLTAGDRVLPSQITATERFTSAPAVSYTHLACGGSY